PENPVLVSDGQIYANSFVVSQGSLYTIDGRGFVVVLSIFDVSDPFNTRFVGRSDSWSSLGYASFLQIAVSDTTAYIITADYLANAFGVVDVSDPRTPTLVSSQIFADGLPIRIFAHQTHAYVAASGAGLMIFDGTNPSHAVRVGQFYTAIQANSI